MNQKKNVLVIGAGLAGLSAAYYLLKKKYNVRIVEKGSRVGGLAVTDEERGFSFDKTGHLLHFKNTTIKKLVLQDIFEGGLKEIERKSRVWSCGVYTEYPFQSNTFGLPSDVANECLAEYFRVKYNPPFKKVKSFEDFIYNYFGKGFAKYFMIPYNKKIWGVHPREMSTEWCDRFVPIPQLENVIAGSTEYGQSRLGYNAAFHYPATGIQELPERFSSILADKGLKVELQKAVEYIDFKQKQARTVDGEIIDYDVLVSTISLKELISHTESLPDSVIKMGKLLRYKPLYYLNIAINKPANKPIHWVYVPSPKIPFYRVGIYSNFSSSCAPKGCSSLYVELSGRNFTDDMTPDILDHLVQMGMIQNKSDILFVRPNYIEYAYVIYDHNYSKVVPKIHKFLNKHDVYSVGRYGAWNYSGMEDAILMGKEVADLF